MRLLFEKAKECPSCWEKTQFFSEPILCAQHKEQEFDPSWTAADRQINVDLGPSKTVQAVDVIRLREPSAFDSVKRDLTIIQLLGQLEEKLDRLIAGLTARGSL